MSYKDDKKYSLEDFASFEAIDALGEQIRNNWNKNDADGYTPLCAAILNNADPLMLLYLTEIGNPNKYSDVGYYDDNGDWQSDGELVIDGNFLPKVFRGDHRGKFADVTKVCDKGKTAVQIALMCGNVNALKALLGDKDTIFEVIAQEAKPNSELPRYYTDVIRRSDGRTGTPEYDKDESGKDIYRYVKIRVKADNANVTDNIRITPQNILDAASMPKADLLAAIANKYTNGSGSWDAPFEGIKWTQTEIDAASDGDPAYNKTTDDWKVESATDTYFDSYKNTPMIVVAKAQCYDSVKIIIKGLTGDEYCFTPSENAKVLVTAAVNRENSGDAGEDSAAKIITKNKDRGFQKLLAPYCIVSNNAATQLPENVPGSYNCDYKYLEQMFKWEADDSILEFFLERIQEPSFEVDDWKYIFTELYPPQTINLFYYDFDYGEKTADPSEQPKKSVFKIIVENLDSLSEQDLEKLLGEDINVLAIAFKNKWDDIIDKVLIDHIKSDSIYEHLNVEYTWGSDSEAVQMTVASYIDSYPGEDNQDKLLNLLLPKYDLSKFDIFVDGEYYNIIAFLYKRNMPPFNKSYNKFTTLLSYDTIYAGTFKVLFDDGTVSLLQICNIADEDKRYACIDEIFIAPCDSHLLSQLMNSSSSNKQGIIEHLYTNEYFTLDDLASLSSEHLVDDNTLFGICLSLFNNEIIDETDLISITDDNFKTNLLAYLHNAGVINNDPVIVVSDTEGHQGREVQLDASESTDEDNDPLSWYWTGPLTLIGNTTAKPKFTIPNDAVTGTEYTFTVTVSDGHSGVKSAPVKVTVVNGKPTARVTYSTYSSTPGATVELDASNSTDPDGDELSYTWTSTPANLLTAEEAVKEKPKFIIPSDLSETTSYIFTVTVSDGHGESDYKQVTVTAVVHVNELPVAVANNAEGLPGQTITLDASSSYDPDGTIEAYTWSGDHAADLVGSTTATPSFTIPNDATPGNTYEFTVTVTDNEGATNDKTITVTVLEPITIGEPAFTTGAFAVIFVDSNDTMTISDKTNTTVTVEVYEKDEDTNIWAPHTHNPTKYLHNDYNVYDVWSDMYQVAKYYVEQVAKSPYWTPTNKVFNYDLLYDDNADD